MGGAGAVAELEIGVARLVEIAVAVAGEIRGVEAVILEMVDDAVAAVVLDVRSVVSSLY